jgi:hypothetical protein
MSANPNIPVKVPTYIHSAYISLPSKRRNKGMETKPIIPVTSRGNMLHTVCRLMLINLWNARGDCYQFKAHLPRGKFPACVQMRLQSLAAVFPFRDRKL